MPATIFGRQSEICTSGDGRRSAATCTYGNSRKGGPAHVGDAFAKLAAGPATLTAKERIDLETIGIEIVQVPREEPRDIGNRLLAEGVPPVDVARRVAEEVARPDAFTSAEPIRSVTFFRPTY